MKIYRRSFTEKSAVDGGEKLRFFLPDFTNSICRQNMMTWRFCLLDSSLSKFLLKTSYFGSDVRYRGSCRLCCFRRSRAGLHVWWWLRRISIETWNWIECLKAETFAFAKRVILFELQWDDRREFDWLDNVSPLEWFFFAKFRTHGTTWNLTC